MAKNLGINSFSGDMSRGFPAVSTAGNLGGICLRYTKSWPGTTPMILGERTKAARDDSYFPILNEEAKYLEPQNPQNHRVGKVTKKPSWTPKMRCFELHITLCDVLVILVYVCIYIYMYELHVYIPDSNPMHTVGFFQIFIFSLLAPKIS